LAHALTRINTLIRGINTLIRAAWSNPCLSVFRASISQGGSLNYQEFKVVMKATGNTTSDAKAEVGRRKS